MEITKHISQLLHQHECVILPDFGGFVTNYQEARIDSVNHAFYPPRKDVMFNRQLTQNDGLLINYLAQVEGIEYVKSKKMVVGFVKDSLNKLKTGNSLLFEGIGRFYYDEHKLLQFEPDTSANFLLESYGLSSFHYPALQNNAPAEKRKATRFIDRKPLSPKARKVLKRALVVAPLVAVLGVLPFTGKMIDTKPVTQQFSVFPMSIFSNPTKEIPMARKAVDPVAKTVYIGPHDITEAFAALGSNNENTIETDAANENKYFIIVGSCSNRSEANRFSNNLMAMGYNPISLDPDKGRYRIALAGFASKKEAVDELALYRHTEFPSAWIWTHR